MSISAGSMVSDHGRPRAGRAPLRSVRRRRGTTSMGTATASASRFASSPRAWCRPESQRSRTRRRRSTSTRPMSCGPDRRSWWGGPTRRARRPGRTWSMRTFDAEPRRRRRARCRWRLRVTSKGDVTLARRTRGRGLRRGEDDANGFEQIRVHTGSLDWTVGPAFLPPSVRTKIALVELDAAHLLVSFSVGVDPAETGVPNASSQVLGAILEPCWRRGRRERGARADQRDHRRRVCRDGARVRERRWSSTGCWSTARGGRRRVAGDPNGEQMWAAPVGPAADGGLTAGRARRCCCRGRRRIERGTREGRRWR